jgi:hypothetical protein
MQKMYAYQPPVMIINNSIKFINAIRLCIGSERLVVCNLKIYIFREQKLIFRGQLNLIIKTFFFGWEFAIELLMQIQLNCAGFE